MRIEMHPVTYAQMLKWTGDDFDQISLSTLKQDGVLGFLVLGGRKRKMDVSAVYPNDDNVVIRCSVEELRYMMQRLREKQIDLQGENKE